MQTRMPSPLTVRFGKRVNRLLKTAPLFGFEDGFIAMMEAEFDVAVVFKAG